jgi:hypothetical protein
MRLNGGPLAVSYTGTTSTATASEEMNLGGRKYTLFRSLALLSGPLLLFWATVVILAIDALHRHVPFVGVK